jgi:hypothetical protein
MRWHTSVNTWEEKNETQSSVDRLHPGGALLRLRSECEGYHNARPNVIATGSGTLDLTDLTLFAANNSTGVFIDPTTPLLIMGSTIIVGGVDLYEGISGPTTFRTGDFSTFASTGSGNELGILSESRLVVPHDYVSGMELSATATWDNTTIDALGATPGIYTWNCWTKRNRRPRSRARP